MKGFHLLALLLFIYKIRVQIQAFDVAEMCPLVASGTCPTKTLSTGDVIQLVAKSVPLDFANLPVFSDAALELAKNVRHLYCATPACMNNPCLHESTCYETDVGFRCSCADGYNGTTCEQALLGSVEILGDNDYQGRIAVSPKATPTMNLQVLEEGWTQNASHLTCEYLGFKGVYATAAQVPQIDTTGDQINGTTRIECPDDAGDISQCWHTEQRMVAEEHVIAIVCCPGNPCESLGIDLGVESGTLPDSDLTSSSCLAADTCSQHARLNGVSAWIPSISNQDQWLQISFESTYFIASISTQGRSGYSQRVTSYKLSHSSDNTQWSEYLDEYSGTTKVFAGNYDDTTAVTHGLPTPIFCQYLRVLPQTYIGQMALRLELTGYGPMNESIVSLNEADGRCIPDKGDPLGMEDGTIPDSSLTSSSHWAYDGRHLPPNGRLNFESDISQTQQSGAWVATDEDQDKWIKADLGSDHAVTGFIIQGRYDHAQWVTSARFSYSSDDANWKFMMEEECGNPKTYPANFDRNTHVTVIFAEPITARYVRIHPITYYSHASMRFEILGYVI